MTTGVTTDVCSIAVWLSNAVLSEKAHESWLLLWVLVGGHSTVLLLWTQLTLEGFFSHGPTWNLKNGTWFLSLPPMCLTCKHCINTNYCCNKTDAKIKKQVRQEGWLSVKVGWGEGGCRWKSTAPPEDLREEKHGLVTESAALLLPMATDVRLSHLLLRVPQNIGNQQ